MSGYQNYVIRITSSHRVSPLLFIVFGAYLTWKNGKIQVIFKGWKIRKQERDESDNRPWIFLFVFFCSKGRRCVCIITSVSISWWESYEEQSCSRLHDKKTSGHYPLIESCHWLTEAICSGFSCHSVNQWTRIWHGIILSVFEKLQR